MKTQLSRLSIVAWIFCLAAVSVGARNFEQGLSLDGPLYATIAREIARSAEYFRLDGRIPEFSPFAEHPHLGFWVVSWVYRILPAADWSTRLVGHLFYVAFLLLFFFQVRTLSSERTALGSVFLLWCCPLFSNTFSNFYLDPGVLFFGSAAVFLFLASVQQKRFTLAILAGLSLSASLLYKGVTAVGFIPALFVILFFERGGLRFLTTGLAICLASLGLYYGAVLHSHFPNFFEVYWARQFANRFAPRFEVLGIFWPEYWKRLMSYTANLAPLALLAFWDIKKQGKWNLSLALPLTLFSSFVFLFAGAGLAGGQYLVMVLPWLVWLMAIPLSWIRINEIAFLRTTGLAALLIFFVLQYIPLRTHSVSPTVWQLDLRKKCSEKNIQRIWLDAPATATTFVLAAATAWYADVRVEYPSRPVPRALSDHLYLLQSTTPAREQALKQQGWQLEKTYEETSLWSARPG